MPKVGLLLRRSLTTEHCPDERASDLVLQVSARGQFRAQRAAEAFTILLFFHGFLTSQCRQTGQQLA